ncbi:hypothetical protein H072_5783 [Dactylellina haptotyla CBS 200.50]|uniref:Uncharacterized protein n=1 Tax=Dactylellina haptotyla (strain CBS 200.50) TaxID=1284197 RepID=S8AGW7_DACHA|nr:hypothetical protein H072_5783 [Dactylellina haptotyla CBS 200.50]
MTLVTQINSQTGLSTLWPTNSEGSAVSDGSFGTKTVVTYITQPRTTITQANSVTGITTEYPIDNDGSTITDGSEPITVITYVIPAVVTLTRPNSQTGLTTAYPTDSAGSTIIDGTFGTKTIITYFVRQFITITSLNSSTGLTTIYPTDDAGLTLSGPSDTISIVTYITQPSITITEINTVTGLTTVWPVDDGGITITDGSDTVTVITYLVPPTVTRTISGASQYTTTLYPEASDGSTISDGTRTVIKYFTQPYITTTNLGSSVYRTTLYPTDSAGSTIEDGSETISVIQYTTVAATTRVIRAATTPATRTVIPANAAGTATIFEFRVPPVNTAIAGQPYTCDSYGYVTMNDATSSDYYRVDLNTGARTLIKTDLFGTSRRCVGLGYNSMDNYMYAVDNINDVYRVSLNGVTSKVFSNPQTGELFAIEVDEIGQLYTLGASNLITGVQTWNQLDANPYSPTYGQRIRGGSFTKLALGVPGDWVVVPGFPQRLWTLAIDPSSHLGLYYADLSASKWVYVRGYPTVPGRFIGTMFSDANGNIWGYENDTGNIWLVNVYDARAPVLASKAPVISGTDGGRCVYPAFGA